jgi:hypothetical protein
MLGCWSSLRLWRLLFGSIGEEDVEYLCNESKMTVNREQRAHNRLLLPPIKY